DDNSTVTSLGGGRFAVTWEDCLDDIQPRVYDSAGNDITGSPTIVTKFPDDTRALSQVVGLTNGGYAVLWQGSDGLNDQVFVNTFDADGNEVSGQFSASSTSGNDDQVIGNSFGNVPYQDFQAIAVLDHGFAVVWASSRDDGGGH